VLSGGRPTRHQAKLRLNGQLRSLQGYKMDLFPGLREQQAFLIIQLSGGALHKPGLR
jgi:hypothetical protein